LFKVDLSSHKRYKRFKKKVKGLAWVGGVATRLKLIPLVYLSKVVQGLRTVIHILDKCIYLTVNSSMLHCNKKGVIFL